MHRLIFLTALSIFSLTSFSQQKKWKLTSASVLKDSTGRQYEFAEWSELLYSGRYTAVAADTSDANTSFILRPVPDEVREKWILNMPQPKESAAFTTGKKFSHFKGKTITGEKIDTKKLKGRILVINYWFINCMPCRKEIPELNSLVKRFEGDTSVVFISVARDAEYDLAKFLETTPFSYGVIADNVGGRGISSFPTNVVVDQQGNVAFHTSGFYPATVYWIRKAIEGLKSGGTAPL